MFYVYRIYDKNETLLYVGSTMNIDIRMKVHLNGAPWRKHFDHYTTERFDSRTDMLDAEACIIGSENPLFNRAGRKSDWNGATDYIPAGPLPSNWFLGRMHGPWQTSRRRPLRKGSRGSYRKF